MTQFGVILADPAWEYRNGGPNGGVDAQYQTMTDAEIRSLPVPSWAARDAVLCLWATWPKLDAAMSVLEAWQFDYVTGFPWIKTMPHAGTIRRGVGFWSQGASEPFLIGRRGNPKRKDGHPVVMGLLTGEERQFYSPAKDHSAKPAGVHWWIEDTLEGPYLELFARQDRPGWTCYGSDTGFRLSDSGVEEIERPPRTWRQLSLLDAETR